MKFILRLLHWSFEKAARDNPDSTLDGENKGPPPYQGSHCWYHYILSCSKSAILIWFVSFWLFWHFQHKKQFKGHYFAIENSIMDAEQEFMNVPINWSLLLLCSLLKLTWKKWLLYSLLIKLQPQTYEISFFFYAHTRICVWVSVCVRNYISYINIYFHAYTGART